MNTISTDPDNASEELQLKLCQLFDGELSSSEADALHAALDARLAHDPEAQAFEDYLQSSKGLFSKQAAAVPVPSMDEALLSIHRAIREDAAAGSKEAGATQSKPAGKKIAFPLGIGIAVAAAIAALMAIAFLPKGGAPDMGDDQFFAVNAENAVTTPAIIESVETDIPNAVISVFDSPGEEMIPVIWISEMPADLEGVEL